MEFGQPKDEKDLKDFILEKINSEDRKILDKAVSNASKAIEEIVENGIDIAMNKFN